MGHGAAVAVLTSEDTGGIVKLIPAATDAAESVNEQVRVGRLEITLVRRPPEQAEWLEAVCRDWRRLGEAPVGIQADKEVVLAALRRSGGALQFAAPDLQ